VGLPDELIDPGTPVVPGPSARGERLSGGLRPVVLTSRSTCPIRYWWCRRRSRAAGTVVRCAGG